MAHQLRPPVGHQGKSPGTTRIYILPLTLTLGRFQEWVGFYDFGASGYYQNTVQGWISFNTTRAEELLVKFREDFPQDTIFLPNDGNLLLDGVGIIFRVPIKTANEIVDLWSDNKEEAKILPYSRLEPVVTKAKHMFGNDDNSSSTIQLKFSTPQDMLKALRRSLSPVWQILAHTPSCL
eukprot:TRINITY_DN5508_c1_g1_i1.p2 TRINITY_DN5508_c1_g1~~TRINITY_DN5508_c1_g1_i1.p2  ORF type:complete len:179 (+),score=22.56 TRINITY_DN5508_c1_g1_i1:112-648(+)